MADILTASAADEAMGVEIELTEEEMQAVGRWVRLLSLPLLPPLLLLLLPLL